MLPDTPALRATPFHARAAGANRDNAWLTRNGFTLARRYGDAGEEALRARTNVALLDISWRWRVAFEGAAAPAFLSRLLTRDVSALAPGQALKALWLADGGGVRGAGLCARYGKESFLLAAAASDADWIFCAAQSFGLAARDVTEAEGGLALVGPFATATLEAAGLPGDLEPLTFRRLSWRGADVTLSRWGEQGGYELWCAPDDGLLVWDRLMRAGERFAIAAAGIEAADLLDLEAGVARPGLDYRPADDGEAAAPEPALLGLERLIDPEHSGFNGRAGLDAAKSTRRLVGVEIEADRPAPFTPLRRNGAEIGHTLRSAYSPALRRAIALALVDSAAAEPGTAVTLTLPPGMDAPVLHEVRAQIARLPFLPPPASIAP